MGSDGIRVTGSGFSFSSDDINKMSVEEAAVMILANRAGLLDSKVREEINAMQEDNKKLKKANDMLAKIRAEFAEVKDDKKKDLSKEAREFMKDKGIDIPDSGEDLNKAGRDAVINNVQGYVQQFTDENQLKTIVLQQILGKQQRANEITSQVLQKMSEGLNARAKDIGRG